jgi:hypothetical protein
MSQNTFKDRQPRHPIISIQGHMLSVTKEDATHLSIIDYIDVSYDGLGIYTPEIVEPGSQLTLTIDNDSFAMEVVYCLRDLLKRGLYRCGLHTKDHNLVKLLVDSGFCVVERIED